MRREGELQKNWSSLQRIIRLKWVRVHSIFTALLAAPGQRSDGRVRTCGSRYLSRIRLQWRRLPHGQHEMRLRRPGARFSRCAVLLGQTTRELPISKSARSIRGASEPVGALCRPHIAGHDQPQTYEPVRDSGIFDQPRSAEHRRLLQGEAARSEREAPSGCRSRFPEPDLLTDNHPHQL